MLNLQRWLVIIVAGATWLGAGAGKVDAATPGKAEIRGLNAVITVGPDADCDFTSVQAAVNATTDGDEIRVMSGIYNEGISIFLKALRVVGGFPDCSSASPSGRSTLDQGGSGLVVDIFYPSTLSDPLREVVLENWRFRNGGGTGLFVGGVVVEGRPGRLAVELNNVEISGNVKTGVADNGAGLRVQIDGDEADTGGVPFGPLVQIDNDSAIVGNSTGGRGGGIYCESGFNADFRGTLRMGSTLVFDNQAEDGGGLAINGCKNVRMFSGGPIVLFFPTGGIVGNIATRNGGGIYIENGGEVSVEGRALSQVGDPEEAGLISGNQAEAGGAATVRGEGSRLQLRDTYVTGNSADVFGGAFRIISGAELDISRLADSGPCREAQSGGGVLSRPPCTIIENNTSGNRGGVFSLSGSATANVLRAIIRDNDAPDGAIADVGNLTIDAGPPSVLTMQSVLLRNNTGGSSLNARSSGTIDIRYSTAVDHPGGLGRASAAAGKTASIEVTGSILDGNSALFTNSGDGMTEILGRCIISDIDLAASGFDSAEFYSVVDPEFVDRSGGDFHLGPQSSALDYCDNSGAPLTGIDLVQRGAPWDGPSRPVAPNAVPGNFDLGAFVGRFQPLDADIKVDVVAPEFIGGSQSSLALTITVLNNGPETAFAPINVLDDIVVPALSNRTWSCSAPAGSSCTPASGSGRILATVGDLDPGQSAVFSITATLADPDQDQQFSYGASALESQFNIDPSLANNNDEVRVQVGLFADGFENAP